MELVLLRRYFPFGTNGQLMRNGQRICYTIELPWRNNQRMISCIPEGRYRLVKRYSQRFKHHIHLQHVPGRTFILFHPFNHAMNEAQGCIAPVTRIIGQGRGTQSRKAFNRLLQLVYGAINSGQQVFLTIQTDPNATASERIL